MTDPGTDLRYVPGGFAAAGRIAGYASQILRPFDKETAQSIMRTAAEMVQGVFLADQGVEAMPRMEEK